MAEQTADSEEEWALHRVEEVIADKEVEVVWDVISSDTKFI